MNRSLLLIAFASLIACESEEQTPELISFEELAGETGTVAPAETDQDQDPFSYAPAFRDFVAGQTGHYDTAAISAPHALDRFGYSTTAKLKFTGRTVQGTAQDKLPTASVCYYTFTDSIKTKNAFYNWLDCFGTNCESIQLNKKVDKIEANPSLTLVYDTTIVAVEYGCSDARNGWKSFQDSLIGVFGKGYKYRLEVKCNGPAEWK